ncbi:MAG: lysylphosphatidylglycerol synthase domain-containing protein [bacterium]
MKNLFSRFLSNKRKFTFNLLIYLSLVFLIYYLFKLDLVSLKDFHFNTFPLVLSFIFLLLGFILSAISWKKSLNVHGRDAKLRDVLVSHGLPIFSKYIPGKLWTIIGRAGLIRKKINLSIGELTIISLKEQLTFIWSGLIIGLWLAFEILKPLEWTVYVIFILFLSLFLFNKYVHQTFLKISNKLIHKNLDIPYINIKNFFPVILTCITYWFCWTLGYYFFVNSIIETNIPIYTGTIFPLSAVIGLVAIFIPGGIGVREGIMVLGLMSIGINADIAAGIAILSRVWFLTGEIFIFVLAIFLKRNKIKPA